jgi:hypothetical protein
MTTANEERAFTDAQVEESGRLMEEMPRIEAGLKNYLSLKMAEGLTASSMEVSAATPSSSSSASSSAALQGCARVLLKTLNAMELPPAPEWSQRHPQGDEETGIDFMSRLSSYRIVQALWAKCLAAGQKPAKLLGKSSLKFALPEAVAQVLANPTVSAEAAKASEEELRSFLAGFESALAGDVSDPSSEASIVWCDDLRNALAARQQVRKVEAQERADRQKSADAFSSELQATLTGHSPPATLSSTVRIEEA